MIGVTDAVVIVKKKTRVPEPALTLTYGELARLERETHEGMSAGKILGVGLATGAGAILTLLAFFAMVAD